MWSIASGRTWAIRSAGHSSSACTCSAPCSSSSSSSPKASLRSEIHWNRCTQTTSSSGVSPRRPSWLRPRRRPCPSIILRSGWTESSFSMPKPDSQSRVRSWQKRQVPSSSSPGRPDEADAAVGDAVEEGRFRRRHRLLATAGFQRKH